MAEEFEPVRSDFAEFQEGYIRHYIALADTKAGLTFALSAGIISYLLSDGNVRDVIRSQQCISEFGVIGLCLLFLGMAAGISFMVIAPRLSSPSNEGIVFFGAVSARSSADIYVEEIAALSDADLVNARLRHCHDIARICSRKYDLLKKSMWLMVPGLACAWIVNLTLD